MDGINMNLIGMDMALGNAGKAPLDTEGFSKILNMILGQGEIVTDEDVDGAETLAYLIDPTMINVIRPNEQLSFNTAEFTSQKDIVSRDAIEGLLESPMEHSISKISTEFQGLGLEDKAFVEDAVLQVSKDMSELNPMDLELTNASKSMEIEIVEDLEFESWKIKDSKTNITIEPSNQGDKDNSLNGLSQESNLEISKEEMALNPKEVQINTEEKLPKKKEEPEIKSFSLEDMQNSLRKIEIRSIDTKTIEIPALSQENLEIFQDSIVELMEIRSQGENSTMNVKLIPKELGSIDISLKMEEGKLVAKIVVENEQARQMFSSNMKSLNQSLQRQDISIEEIQIDLNLNSNPGSKGDDNRQGQRPFRKNNFRFEEMDSFKEIPIRATVMDGIGMSILA